MRAGKQDRSGAGESESTSLGEGPAQKHSHPPGDIGGCLLLGGPPTAIATRARQSPGQATDRPPLRLNSRTQLSQIPPSLSTQQARRTPLPQETVQWENE